MWRPELDTSEHVDSEWHCIESVRQEIAAFRGGWLHPVSYLVLAPNSPYRDALDLFLESAKGVFARSEATSSSETEAGASSDPVVGVHEKIGAGLFIVSGDMVMLLKRHPDSGNGGTWGLPGGNQDPEDHGDLW